MLFFGIINNNLTNLGGNMGKRHNILSISTFKNSKYIQAFSLTLNIIIGILFCNTFTKVTFPNSLWVGFLSFIGADSIYKKFEGKLSSHSELRKKK